MRKDCEHETCTCGSSPMTDKPIIEGAMELTKTVQKCDRDGEMYMETEEAAQRISNFARAYAGELRATLEGLFEASKNEMVCRGLPLEWRPDTAMGRAEKALDGKREG